VLYCCGSETEPLFFAAVQACSKADPLRPTYTPRPALPLCRKKSLREVKEAIPMFYMKLRK
jgi:hypothetical protein